MEKYFFKDLTDDTEYGSARKKNLDFLKYSLFAKNFSILAIYLERKSRNYRCIAKLCIANLISNFSQFWNVNFYFSSGTILLMTIGIPENPLLHLETIFTQKFTVSDLILKKSENYFFFQNFVTEFWPKLNQNPKFWYFLPWQFPKNF